MTSNEKLFRAMLPKAAGVKRTQVARARAVKALAALPPAQRDQHNDYVSRRLGDIHSIRARRNHLQAVRQQAFDALVERFVSMPSGKLERLAHKAIWFGLHRCYDAISNELTVRESL